MRRIRHTMLILFAAFAVTALAPATASAATVSVAISGAGRVYEKTDAQLIDCSSPSTTRNGVVGATCSSSGYGWLWIVVLSAEPAPGYSFAGWSGACSGAACVFETGFGTHAVTATFVDTTPPDTTISGGPAALTHDRSAAFTLGHTQAGSTISCRLDFGAWAPCSSPHFVGPLVDGTHVLHAYATDPNGNADPTMAVHEWTIDTVAPTTAITSGPQQLTREKTVSIGFAGTDATQFQCRSGRRSVLSSTGWYACTSPTSVTATIDGEYALQVRGIDAAGNIGAVVERAWTHDGTAPIATYSDGPAQGSWVQAGSVTIGFSANEAGVRWECQYSTPLATTELADCTSPTRVTTTATGTHWFAVRARDVAGNIGGWNVRTWIVDGVAPPAPTIEGGTREFTVTDSEAGVTLQCRAARAIDIQSIDWGACASPLIVEATTIGDWLLEARALDAAGNVSEVARRAWTVAAPAPVVEPAPQPTPTMEPAPASPAPNPATPSAQDTTAPRLVARGPAVLRVAARTATVRARCGERCTLEAVALVAGRRVGRPVRSAAPIGTIRNLRIAIPASIRAQARRRGSALLVVRLVAADAAGNRSTRLLRIRVVR